MSASAASLINLRDLRFLLYDWLALEELCERERYSEHSREVFDAVIDTALEIAVERFANHAAKLDLNEPTFDGERVHIIPEVKEALDAFAEAGFIAGPFGAEHGGLQLPYTVSQSAMAIFYSANTATAAYPLLTMAAASLIATCGSPEQRERYLGPMLDGRFTGTMALSEPQAGSALGDLRTLATPQPDGTYRLTGDKMWISAAEHDMSDNIINLVLARTPGAPAGTRGISLFIVPKWLDGGQRNGVHISGLNHKMGYRGTVNTVLHFEEATGYRVGEEHRGLPYMFHMMNEARVGVGLGAAMLGYAGYLFSLDYARQRPQGRPPWQRDPKSPPVNIIEHTDVRRMLLAQKAYVEGGLALCLFCARLVDDAATLPSAEDRADAELLLSLLTPIAKHWPSEYCLEANKLAIQVLGGYGYSQEYPVERYYRDNRLNAIHEGTTGIQALDLLGRKVRAGDGAALKLLLSRIQATLKATAGVEGLAEHAAALGQAVRRAGDVTAKLLGAAGQGDLPRALANATIYLDMMGHTVVAWLWLDQARVAHARLQETADPDAVAFFRGKLQACRYFFRHELPKTAAQADLLASLDDTCLSMSPEWF
ncbi:MAG: alkylation response protein AidB-like acyl-CoA dehydrogenase [Myxococcota bacterium]